jgi:arginase
MAATIGIEAVGLPAIAAAPLVLGGDFSIRIGIAFGAHRQGRFGMLFLDGHADFFSPASEPNGEVALMEPAARLLSVQY